MELRLGLAGLGVHGERYARHLLAGDVPAARLTAISRQDRVAGLAFAERHGLEFVADPRELAVHPAVDAVLVVLTPDLHADVASACVANDRPVLVEKPLATDGPSAERLVELARLRGTPLMVAHTLRFDPLIERMKRELPTLGPLRMITINQRFEPHPRDWLDSPGKGGLLLNTGVHGFDLLRFLSGLEAVAIRARTRKVHTRRTEDQFVAILDLEPGGVQAVIDNSRASNARSGRIELIGDEAQLWGDHIHRSLQRVRGREIEQLGPLPAAPTLPRVVAAFVAALAAGEPPPVDGGDGLAAVRLADAALRSAETDRTVRL